MSTAINVYRPVSRLVLNILRYRIHISLIFFFLLFYNNLRTGAPVNYALCVSFALWHFALFLFDRIYDRDLDKVSQPDEFIPESQAKVLYGFVGLLMAVSFGIYWMTGFALWVWFVLFPITFLYVVPVYKGIRSKNIFLVKNLYSAVLIFALPLALQAMLLSGQQPIAQPVFSAIISLGIYVLIGEMFWDIRDMTVDKENGIATIPNTLGLVATKIIILALILFDAIKTDFSFNLSALIYFILLTFVKEKTDRLIFHLPPLVAIIRFCL